MKNEIMMLAGNWKELEITVHETSQPQKAKYSIFLICRVWI